MKSRSSTRTPVPTSKFPCSNIIPASSRRPLLFPRPLFGFLLHVVVCTTNSTTTRTADYGFVPAGVANGGRQGHQKSFRRFFAFNFAAMKHTRTAGEEKQEKDKEQNKKKKKETKKKQQDEGEMEEDKNRSDEDDDNDGHGQVQVDDFRELVEGELNVGDGNIAGVGPHQPFKTRLFELWRKSC